MWDSYRHWVSYGDTSDVWFFGGLVSMLFYALIVLPMYYTFMWKGLVKGGYISRIKEEPYTMCFLLVFLFCMGPIPIYFGILACVFFLWVGLFTVVFRVLFFSSK